MATTQIVPDPVTSAPVTPASSGAAVLRLTTRLIRRGTLVLAASMAAYAAVEMISYAKAYPDAASRARLASFGEVGAARALQGIPRGIEHVGGFVAWDGGWMIQSIVAVWAILLTGRLLRGEEEDGRADWILTGPVRASRALALQLAVLVSASVLVAFAVTAALGIGGAELVGSALFGVALAGFAATFVTGCAVTCQLFGLRRRAIGAAGAGLGAAFVLRMVADSADSRGWLRLFTPYGWMEELEPFAARRWPVLGLLVLAPVLLGTLAVTVRGRRDLGGSLVGGSDRHAPRLRLLGSPAGYAWRSAEGVLLSWALGLGAYSFAMGSLVRSMTDYLASDEGFRKTMDSVGMGAAITPDGFVGVMGVLLGVGFALYACWRIAGARTEESCGRAELVLSRRVTRTRWLTAQIACTVLAVTVVLGCSAVALWGGAAATGADVSFVAALKAVLNSASVVCLFGGVAVLILGVLPRAVAVVPVVLVVVSYLVQMIGPSLELPGWVMDLSAFHHLAYVPAQPFAAASAAWMVGVGVAAALAGLVAFHLRDLRGA